MHVSEIIESLQSSFGWLDYVIFLGMLLGCSGVGVYYALKDLGAKSTINFEENYLVGGRKMKIFPVAMSLIASWISGISVLGNVTEFYVYGSGFSLIFVSTILSGLFVSKTFLPVFVELQIMSLYEYLQIRFDRRVRLFGSIIFLIVTITTMSIVIYVPALAFNQVTGFNIQSISIFVCIVCIFYTCIGGIKAVIWTDVIQTVIMIGTIIFIIIKGVNDVGGLSVVLERNFNSTRLELPPMSLDLTERITVPSMLIGATMYWCQSITIYQSIVQRYISLPDLRSAIIATWVFVIGAAMIFVLCGSIGLIAYATFYDCDPMSSKLIKAGDQLLPLLVMKLFQNLPGLPGLFVAGIFSAALSTLSTGLNSVSTIILEDLIKPFQKRPLTQNQTKHILRGMVVLIGIIGVSLVFVVAKLGTVLQLTMSLMSVGAGPLFAIFIMGVLIPWINGRSALFGGICGVCIMITIILKAQADISSGVLSFPKKPFSVDGCQYEFDKTLQNTTFSVNDYDDDDDDYERKFEIHHVSFLWYVPIGVITTLLCSFVSSLVFGRNSLEDFDRRLLAPYIRKYLPEHIPLASKEEEMERITEKN